MQMDETQVLTELEQLRATILSLTNRISRMQPDITFPRGSVPVKVAARVYGKDRSWVRAGIVAGCLSGQRPEPGRLLQIRMNCILIRAESSITFLQSYSMNTADTFGKVKKSEKQVLIS